MWPNPFFVKINLYITLTADKSIPKFWTTFVFFNHPVLHWSGACNTNIMLDFVLHQGKSFFINYDKKWGGQHVGRIFYHSFGYPGFRLPPPAAAWAGLAAPDVCPFCPRKIRAHLQSLRTALR
jgi:hypothetical protein